MPQPWRRTASGRSTCLAANLYPFAETVAAGADEAACIETIDIGGPALIRAAAKNHRFVAVASAPAHLDDIRVEMETDGATPLALRRRLAAEAYGHTAAYDAAVANWFAERTGAAFPPRLALPGVRRQALRYGENPHQAAAFYTDGSGRPGVATAEQLQGKALSYNNLNDLDAAFELAGEFERPAVVIVKHANPCGAAVADNLCEAWDRALACDPVSAFGGIVAVNRPLDGALADRLARLFLEAVIAPGADGGGAGRGSPAGPASACCWPAPRRTPRAHRHGLPLALRRVPVAEPGQWPGRRIPHRHAARAEAPRNWPTSRWPSPSASM